MLLFFCCLCSKKCDLIANSRYKQRSFHRLISPIQKKRISQHQRTDCRKELRKRQTLLQYFFRDNKTLWFHKFNHSREYVTTMNRLRSNHYNLAASLYRVKIVKKASCKCNHPIEDINHVVWQCQLYDSQKLKLLSQLTTLYHTLLLSIEMIIAHPNSNACWSLFSFLKILIYPFNYDNV